MIAHLYFIVHRFVVLESEVFDGYFFSVFLQIPVLELLVKRFAAVATFVDIFVPTCDAQYVSGTVIRTRGKGESGNDQKKRKGQSKAFFHLFLLLDFL